jgi:hypothetical protein
METRRKKRVCNNKTKETTTPLGIEPRISGSVDQRLIHWATESFDGRFSIKDIKKVTSININ